MEHARHENRVRTQYRILQGPPPRRCEGHGAIVVIVETGICHADMLSVCWPNWISVTTNSPSWDITIRTCTSKPFYFLYFFLPTLLMIQVESQKQEIELWYKKPRKKLKTYNSWYSLVVTDPTTNELLLSLSYLWESGRDFLSARCSQPDVLPLRLWNGDTVMGIQLTVGPLSVRSEAPTSAPPGIVHALPITCFEYVFLNSPSTFGPLWQTEGLSVHLIPIKLHLPWPTLRKVGRVAWLHSQHQVVQMPS